MPRTFLCVFLFLSEAWTYEAPEDKQSVFARKACPAFLTFTNAAYLTGVTVELPCHCKPTQVQSVVWFFRSHFGGAGDTRALTDHHGNKLTDSDEVPHSADLRSRFSIRLFSLLIFRAGPEDTGLYICGSAHKDFFFAYDLDIQEVRSFSFVPRLETRRMPKQTESPPPPYRRFTDFQPWSMCDRCDVQGEQIRVGLCYVQSSHLHVRYRRANHTVASCGSGGVPRALRRRFADEDGFTRMEVRSCQAVCPTKRPPSSHLQSVKEFIGYGSSSLPVYYLNHPAGQDLTMGCPRARSNMVVAWDRESEPIYRSELSKTSDAAPRRLIDSGHHLVFQPVKIQDSDTYYCWLQGRRAAEIRLLVYPSPEPDESLLLDPEFPEALATVLTGYAAMTIGFCLLLLCRAAVGEILEETHDD